MAINTYFEQIQRALGDPSIQGQQKRRDLVRNAGLAQNAFFALGAYGAVLMGASAVSLVANPVLGLIWGATFLFSAHEGFMIARNVQIIAKDSIANLANRVMNVISSDALVSSVLKDTLVTDALLHEFIVEKLNHRVLVY